MDVRKGIIVSRTNLIEKKKETSIPWKGMSLVIFLTLLIYGGAFFYNWNTKKKINQLQATVNQAKQGRDYTKIALVADSENRLKSIRQIFDKRADWEKLLQKIEENTIPEVTYSQMDATLEEKNGQSSLAGGAAGTASGGLSCRIDFRGVTIGLDNLARQVSAFQETRDTNGESFANDVSIQKVELKKTEGDNEDVNGSVDFSLQVDLNPNVITPVKTQTQESVNPEQPTL